MKNLFFAFFSICLMVGFASCGDDDNCTQEDWVGTYTYQGSEPECDLGDSSSIEYETTIIISAGSADDKIEADGFEGTINSENCTTTIFILTLELDGDELKFLPGTACEAIYKKN